ncbi:MAG TPA: hypothetical protein VF715_19050 [Thermoleophilaceae bacterium]
MLRGTIRTRRSRIAAAAAAIAAVFAMPAAAHELDHPVPSFSPQAPPSLTYQSGGIEGIKWEFLGTFPTGNPHTDIDFFQRGGATYASLGTLGVGPNAGGQTIFQLTDSKGAYDPHYVTGVPTASCVSNPANATGLQHDVEATPKANTVLNTDNQRAVRKDTQLIIDATDASGRCHDQGGSLGLSGAPRGGLEIIDVTDPAKPVTIGLTSHIGEAHTVNVDPKRPHIAYAITSDSIGVNAERKRANETGTSNALDGFEVVDLSSCMNFPSGTSVEAKRQACRPQVFRYRYPSVDMAIGHTNKTNGIYGCHETEIYPDDRLACASGAASIVLDMKDAFDDNGTPTDFSDDKLRGTPLPCRVRDSSSSPQFATGAKVTDCVTGTRDGADQPLNVPEWIKIGAPSLAGVKWIGTAYHQGRETTQGSADPAFPSSEDIDFSHETEFTQSGRFLISSDERGGGILPPGASCSPGVDNPTGNGGLHAYRVDQLQTKAPANAEEAFKAYAKTKEGAKAIFRVPVRTKPQAALCTAHVFQQIPGQNRIFMGWYAQGTHVIDYTENADGTIDFKEVGYFIPENANEWVSAIWKVDKNADGSFTYWGATGDFYVGDGGRGTMDLYKVTLPPPPTPAARLPGTGTGFGAERFLFNRQSLKVSRTGGARLRVSCLSAVPCTGSMVVRSTKKFRRSDGKLKTVLMAKRNFTIAPGRSGAKMNLKFTGAGRRLAHMRKGVQVKATASMRFGETTRTFKRTKTLRATR